MADTKPLSVNELIMQLHRLKELPIIATPKDIMHMKRCDYEPARKWLIKIKIYYGRVREHEEVSLEEVREYFFGGQKGK